MISRLEEMKESGVDPNYYLIINGFALFVYVYNLVLLLEASKGYRNLLVCDCALHSCLRFPRWFVAGQFRVVVYITCYVVYRVH